MRMRLRPRVALAVAVTAVLGVGALPGSAATAPAPQVVDQAGDANGVNGQDKWDTLQAESASVPDEPSVATPPANVAAGDILSLTFATVKTPTKKVVRGKKVTVSVPTAFTATLTLAAPPQAGLYYWIVASTETCGSHLFWFQYGGRQPDQTNPTPGTQWSLNCVALFGGKGYVVTAAVRGNSVVWTVPMNAANKDLAPGHVLKDIYVESKVNPTGNGINSLPGVLDRGTARKTYVIGS
jgi:hypothetical protein